MVVVVVAVVAVRLLVILAGRGSSDGFPQEGSWSGDLFIQARGGNEDPGTKDNPGLGEIAAARRCELKLSYRTLEVFELDITAARLWRFGQFEVSLHIYSGPLRSTL